MNDHLSIARAVAYRSRKTQNGYTGRIDTHSITWTPVLNADDRALCHYVADLGRG